MSLINVYDDVYSNISDKEFMGKVEKTAVEELREDEAIKNSCLTQFRDWIDQNKDIENCRTDDNFLLRFLRAKKYSLPQAQQNLLKYINFRQKFQDMLYNLDYKSPKLYELLTNGYIFPSPIRDNSGRLVIFSLIKNFDPVKYNCFDMAKAHSLTYETLLDDEINQIMGFTHVGDVSNSTAQHVTLWSPTDFAYMLKWGEQSIPMRHKEVHIFNMPTAFKYVLDFAKGRISEKIKNRIQIYNTAEDFRKNFNINVLPKEYGGIIPMQEMLDIWKKQLEKKRDTILQLDNIKLLSDKGIISRKNKNYNTNCLGDNDLISLPGAFRRLEVD